MKTFISYSTEWTLLLKTIVRTPSIHAKWLNTLSFLENSGARQIAACEHPTLVKEEMLKHAAEEFRHAHYLKKQQEKLSLKMHPDYSQKSILGGISTLHHMKALNLQISRYLITHAQLHKEGLKEAAYILVTFAIERRAAELYIDYDTALRSIKSKVTVKSIFLEEEEHLETMRKGIALLSGGIRYAEEVCKIESTLHEQWRRAIERDIQTQLGGINSLD